MPAIDVRNLRKSYGDKNALDGVSFSVEAGEIFAILGHNGAGKTTTVETIAGLRTPDSGQVSVLGVDPAQDRDLIREQLGVQLQEGSLPDRLRVEEAMRLFASFYRRPRDVGELMHLLGLDEHRNQPYKALSGGLKQRVSMALSLVGSPSIAVLDELTRGLDPQARRDVWQLVEDVRDSGVTIVLVTHYMEEAERLSDRAAVLDHGRVIALDSPAGLVGSVNAEQRLRFRPSQPLDEQLLLALPAVSRVERSGEQVVVSGGEDLVHDVMSLLAREQVVAEQLRVDQATLEDAFIALTGRPNDEEN